MDFTNNAKQILKAFVKYRKGTPFEPEESDKEQCVRLYGEILKTEVFTQEAARELVKLLVEQKDADAQAAVSMLRTRFQNRITGLDARKEFVYLLARFVKSFHFLSSFFTYSPAVREFSVFAEYVGPQLVKQGSVSDLMRQIRQTDVVKAAVQFQGEVRAAGRVKLKGGRGAKTAGPPLKKVSIQDMIEEIREQFNISDEETLYIKEVTEEKTEDPTIQATVKDHQDDRVYLEGPYQGQVNGQIQAAYAERERYEELTDAKYIDPGAIFDIMAITVIRENLQRAVATQV